MNSMLGTMFETQTDRALARISEVLEKGIIGSRTLELDERYLLRILQNHIGKDRQIARSRCIEQLRNALSKPSDSAMVRQAAMTDRRLRSIIHSLRINGIPVGSTSEADGGHYIITTKEEAKDSTRYMLSQAASFLRVVRVLREVTEDELLDLVRAEVRKPEEDGL